MLSRLLFSLPLAILLSPVTVAQDSAPVLLSRTGGSGSWHNTAELEKAAAAGNTRAGAELGERLVAGDEVKRDVPRGLHLLERAARAGNASASFRIGYMLENGNGVARDNARALAYFQAAAAGGVAEAFYNVGAAYASGRGTRRDFPEALAWMIVGREHHAPGDGETRIREYLRDEKHEDWIAAGEARAPALAAELAAKPMTSFLPPPAPLVPNGAAPSNGTSAVTGPSTPPRFTPGGEVSLPPLPQFHLDIAAPAEKPESDGTPVAVISMNAQRLEWPSLGALERDAHYDHPTALFALGQLLIDGEKVPADVDRGLMLLERGAAQGSVDAAYRLADVYIHGRIAPMDEKRGFAYMLMAASRGSRTAMFNTAALYANGRGTDRNYTEALGWFIVAEHFGADFGAGARIRDYLTRNKPDQIPIAQHRAESLEREIDAALKQQP